MSTQDKIKYYEDIANMMFNNIINTSTDCMCYDCLTKSGVKE